MTVWQGNCRHLLQVTTTTYITEPSSQATCTASILRIVCKFREMNQNLSLRKVWGMIFTFEFKNVKKFRTNICFCNIRTPSASSMPNTECIQCRIFRCIRIIIATVILMAVRSVSLNLLLSKCQFLYNLTEWEQTTTKIQ